MAKATYGETFSIQVLELATGIAGRNIPAVLSGLDTEGSWVDLASPRTDDNGREREFEGVEAEEKTSRLCFDTSTYWQGCTKQFLPEINSVFQVLDAVRHYHVPVDINQFGHSASRGD